MTPLLMILAYLCLLLVVGGLGHVLHSRHTAVDYFLASRTCGAFLLVMFPILVGLVIPFVVLTYVSGGGMRSLSFANAPHAGIPTPCWGSWSSLGVWCFSGFSSLFPLVFASLNWKRVTKAGAMAAILAAAVVWVLLFADAGWGANEEYLFLGMMPVVTIFAASAIALVGVSTDSPWRCLAKSNIGSLLFWGLSGTARPDSLNHLASNRWNCRGARNPRVNHGKQRADHGKRRAGAKISHRACAIPSFEGIGTAQAASEVFPNRLFVKIAGLTGAIWASGAT